MNKRNQDLAVHVEPGRPGGPEGCTAMRLRRTARLVSRRYDELIGEAAGLKVSQYALLKSVDRYGPLSPGDLAARFDLEPSSLTRNLRVLADRGLVSVGPGVDARSRRVDITDAGRAAWQQAQGAWKQAQLELNARLGAERLERMHALLDECLILLGEAGDDIPEGEGNIRD